MKTKIPSLLATLCVGFFLVLTPGEAATVVVNVDAYGLYWDSTPLNGATSGDANSQAGPLTVGNRADATYLRLERSWLSFALPSITAGETLVSAKLRIYYDSKSFSSPNSDVSGDVSLYHNPNHNQTATQASTNQAIYNSANFANTGLTVATPTTDTGTWIELDVATQVLLDYASDPAATRYSSFRLQNDTLTAITAGYNLYTFGRSGEFAPQLILTSIPEPSGVAMAVAGFSALAVWTRIRRHER
ncbi:MAG: hypothetical protein B9S32_00965 [Verrucomicrobia bacterium Tous-C9LFEB]|nr:MAG: hypothetical protein B9S32_00965 [Verrucomicrobia bacterium Tous-C9LFEB]